MATPSRRSAPASPAVPSEKRRQILDAAVKVFARQGFNQCRVSDIADEAGVAYGLLYHYFRAKDEVLDTLFLERWDLMVEVIAEVERGPLDAAGQLRAVASFIVDSYAHDPDLMKVIIVEVTRAANSFGRAHLPDIRRAYDGLATIVQGGIDRGELRSSVDATFAAMAFYGVVEQVLTQWIFDGTLVGPAELERSKDAIVETIVRGLTG